MTSCAAKWKSCWPTTDRRTVPRESRRGSGGESHERTHGITAEEGTYDVARNGRFLMVCGQPPVATQINLVQNWFEELKTRVPKK